MSDVTLFADGLASKWGFCDGDVLDDVVMDWMDQGLIEPKGYMAFDEHALLVAAVRRWLLPVIKAKVDVYEIGTIHNPIRTRSVDGVEIDEMDPSDGDRGLPESVVVPGEDLLVLAAELGLLKVQV